MSRPIAPLALVACAALPTAPAVAHGVAGAHLFVSTLIIDDPNVADEASLPTFNYLPQPSDTNPAPGLYGLNAEFDKRITENFGFGINGGYNWLTQPSAKTATGWSNFVVTLKYIDAIGGSSEAGEYYSSRPPMILIVSSWSPPSSARGAIFGWT
jgi:hypothetical protein